MSLLLNALRGALAGREPIARNGRTEVLFEAAGVPKALWGFAITLYQATTPRIVVVRARQGTAFENIRATVNQTLRHDRFAQFALQDWTRCRMQVDVIADEPLPVKLAELSESVLPEHCDASNKFGIEAISEAEHHAQRSNGCCDSKAWQVQVADWTDAITLKRKFTRFELGVDGLRIVKEGKRRYFLPGDAFVRSILGIGQLRRHIQRLFPGDDIESLTYYRFRSLSFVSGTEPESWLPLYRGLPPVPEVSDASLARAARAGTKWITDSIQSDGRFTYYYDAATDTQCDHEHPARDPDNDPYYNLLRHGGGTITLLLEEQLHQGRLERDAVFGDCRGDERRRRAIERSLDFFVEQLVAYPTACGKEAAYAIYNRKAKLGGSGVGLCALAMYQRLFEDGRYAGSAERLANHLLNEINEQGEFRYYHVYLDKPVVWEDNQKHFSFYYPGEAILGLSQYCQHVCESASLRPRVFDKMHRALRFLLFERPRLHKQHYQTLPSDSWLMMGINDLWEVAEFRKDEYAQFVFADADQMVRLMYTEDDALYPDYVGSFYYHYGDHPYPDGARAEGLLAAYQLALKVGDQTRIARYRDACHKVASATLRLCNTIESVYSAANPARAVGGIRFKLTRQWFRVDTIQHVASFYLKLLATDSRQLNDIEQ
ncbi:MAG: hypothetical protein H6822_14485 [Planctomycetaceae bacterium]|nr:hypothetical protein [Planctomycetales bacterium]MCB9923387.1 hypothetical protein [Planctomycetaceae bacterium]